jgi:photosynthetic reaction center H subunit
METGAITQYIDVAQIVLYLFWIFFAGLIYYLVRENHREGYPMDSGRENGPKVQGWPVPEPKTYKMADGHTILAPDFHRPDGTYHGQPSHGWNGAPLEPVGDPLLAGVGPGAWAQRADVPDMTHHGDVKIVPLRVATDHKVAARDVNPIGLPVIAGDGEVAGHVKDMWIDRAEMMFRYLEIELPSGQRVLAPTPFARIRRTEVELTAILSTQFANVPALRNPDQITLLEEEKVSAYYGAGTLYATPHRQEPIF